MKKAYTYVFIWFVLVIVLLVLAVVTYPSANLKVIACNVGQGDAFLITKGRTQILVDGGPNNRVLDCLGKYVPFWDRTIEIAIVTHPDKDHYFGMIETFKRYRVSMLIANSVDNDSTDYEEFKKYANLEQSKIIQPQTGLKLNASGIMLDFVWPDVTQLDHSIASNANDPSSAVLGAYTSKTPLNNFSAVFHLSYGDFDALFTGDTLPEMTDEVLSTGMISDVEYLKVPHHGSKNGLTKELLEVSKPELSVISVGKNSYGHPHQSVIQMLVENNSNVSRTDEGGDVIVESDGKSWWVK